MKKSNKPTKIVSPSTVYYKQNRQPLKNSFTNHPNISNSSLISNMKLQLSNIKIDVQKLMSEDSEIESYSSNIPSKLQIQIESLKLKLLRSQDSYETLKRELDKYKKQDFNNSNQLKQFGAQNKQLVDRIERMETIQSTLEIDKLKLETEYHRIQGIKSKMQKQQELQQEFQIKISQEKLKLQNQNLKLQSELMEERAKTDITKQLNLVKSKVEAYKIQADRLRIQLKKEKEETNRQLKLNSSLQKLFEQSKLEKDQQWKIQKRSIELKLQENSLEYQNSVNKLTQQNTVLSLKIKEQQDIIQNSLISIIALQQEKSILTKKIQNLVDDNNKFEQQKQRSKDTASQQFHLLISQNKKLNEQLHSLKATIKDFDSHRASTQKKLSDFLEQLNNKIQQIFNLRSQLQYLKKAHSSTIVKTEEVQKGGSKAHHHIQMELQNKVNQITVLKKKMDALNKKVETKTSELKQKDQFIANVIINKVKKEVPVFSLEYLKEELDKYFSPNLFNKVQQLERDIQKLKSTARFQNIK